MEDTEIERAITRFAEVYADYVMQQVDDTALSRQTALLSLTLMTALHSNGHANELGRTFIDRLDRATYQHVQAEIDSIKRRLREVPRAPTPEFRRVPLPRCPIDPKTRFKVSDGLVVSLEEIWAFHKTWVW